MRLTDTHCHLYFQNYQADLDEVLNRSRAAGVERILIPAIDLASSLEITRLIDTDGMLFGAVGVHPNSGESWTGDTLENLQALTAHPRVVAIGEIGLDYYRDRTPPDFQKKILLEQLTLASQVDLPVVLHVRNRSEQDRACIEDLLLILEEWTGEGRQGTIRPPGVIHSFSGNLQESRKAQAMGFYLGITGPVTYKNAEGLRDVARDLDLNRLLIETDGPFLSPQEKRGKRNEPAHVSYIIDKISEIRALAPEEVARQTAENADHLFEWE